MNQTDKGVMNMLNEERIERQCAARKLKVHFGAGVISINTEVSHWRLLHNGDRVYKVMHENYRGIQYNNGHYKSGFHEQKLWNFKIKNILDYIEKHDKIYVQRTNEYDKMFERAMNQRFVIA